MKTACHYSIVRFVPFVETEEFANVGVVLFAPDARYFGFRLMVNRSSRVTNFFEQLESATYRAVMRGLRDELERLDGAFKSLGTDRRYRELDLSRGMALWSEMIKPKESLVRFSEGRVALATDPAEKLKALFGHYVERNFVTREYQEKTLERNVRGVLRSAELADRFLEAPIGNDEYHANFPFVQLLNEKPVKVIKALTLQQSNSARVLDHGGSWIMRVQNLRRRSLLPDRVLFAVDGDADEPSLRGKARREIASELRHLGVTVVPVARQQELIAFARD